MTRQRDGFHRMNSCGVDLTTVERDILRAYSRGMSRREIGIRFGLSERTISHYLTTAKEKLGAENLVHAAVLHQSLDGAHTS